MTNIAERFCPLTSFLCSAKSIHNASTPLLLLYMATDSFVNQNTKIQHSKPLLDNICANRIYQLTLAQTSPFTIKKPLVQKHLLFLAAYLLAAQAFAAPTLPQTYSSIARSSISRHPVRQTQFVEDAFLFSLCRFYFFVENQVFVCGEGYISGS